MSLFARAVSYCCPLVPLAHSSNATTPTTTCVPDTVSLVGDSITHPHQFCTFYLSHNRTRSPLPSMDHYTLHNACQCIASMPDTSDQTELVYASTCAGNVQTLVEQYMESYEFCAFYLAAAVAADGSSPLEGLTTKQVRGACKCLDSASATLNADA